MDETRIQRGPKFKPQRRPVRADGWTAARQREFFRHIRATCNIKLAARAAGMGFSGAYERRRRDPLFAKRWRQALEDGYVRMETMLIARAGGTDDASLARQATAMDADDADALIEVTESLDSTLALALLANHRKALHGGARRRGGPRLKVLNPDEVAADILKKLAALNRARGGEG